MIDLMEQHQAEEQRLRSQQQSKVVQDFDFMRLPLRDDATTRGMLPETCGGFAFEICCVPVIAVVKGMETLRCKNRRASTRFDLPLAFNPMSTVSGSI